MFQSYLYVATGSDPSLLKVIASMHTPDTEFIRKSLQEALGNNAYTKMKVMGMATELFNQKSLGALKLLADATDNISEMAEKDILAKAINDMTTIFRIPKKNPVLITPQGGPATAQQSSTSNNSSSSSSKRIIIKPDVFTPVDFTTPKKRKKRPLPEDVGDDEGYFENDPIGI